MIHDILTTDNSSSSFSPDYEISICIPVYNAQNSIEKLVQTIFHTLKHLKVEVVLVDDYSRDQTLEVLKRLRGEYADLQVLALRKNFGEHNAVMCALYHARGEYVAIMDDDFQNDPTDVLKLLAEAKLGYDVVYSSYDKKMQTPFRKFGSWFNNLAATFVLEKPYSLYLSSFKVIHQDVVRHILKYQGPYPYIDGLLLWATRNVSQVNIVNHPRLNGKSNYTFKKLYNLWLQVFLCYSLRPLKIITLLSLLVFSSGIFFMLKDEKVMALVAAIGFLQLLAMRLMAEYVARNFMTNARQFQWVLRNV